MQKILFLADLHGNMPATLALEKEIEKIKPDDIWFLGDAVGKGPESDKTLDWVRKNCNHFIAGNWDLGCVETGKLCEMDSSAIDEELEKGPIDAMDIVNGTMTLNRIPASEVVNIYFFRGEGCSHCAAEEPFLQN